MKGTRCVDAGKKSTMSKTQKQCWNCGNNDKGYCKFFEAWCYIVNREACNNKISEEKLVAPKVQDQCLNCVSNRKGHCEFFDTWCYSINREQCNEKIAAENILEKKK